MAPPNNSGAVEVRSIPLDAAQPTLTERGIEGYLAVFNQRTAIGDPKTFGFYETITPGAFAKTIQEQDQRSLFNHDPNYPLARRSTGTLQLSEDEHGLKFSIAELPDTSYARDLRENIRNGNIAGSSFQFSVAAGGQAWTDDNGADVRSLTELNMLEGGPVTFPAYEGTAVSLRDAVNAATADRWDDGPELRAKYSADDRKKMAAKGHAMSDGSYPIANADDLDNAIKAVGRGGSSHDAIRKHIIARAKALNLSAKIPDNWNSDGSMKTQSNSADPAAESTASTDGHGEVPASEQARRAYHQRKLRGKALAAMYRLEESPHA